MIDNGPFLSQCRGCYVRSAELDFEKDTEGIAVRRWTENGLFEEPRLLDGTPVAPKVKGK